MELPKIYTEAKVSPVGKVNKEDIKRWGMNTLIFISPAVLIYLGQVQGALTIEGHVFSLKDLIPSTFTLGAIVSWVISTLIDIFRKFNDGKK